MDPAAVRANVEAAARRTDPELPRASEGPAATPSGEVAVLREQLRAYTAEVKQKTARIAELEAYIEELRRRLGLRGVQR